MDKAPNTFEVTDFNQVTQEELLSLVQQQFQHYEANSSSSENAQVWAEVRSWLTEPTSANLSRAVSSLDGQIIPQFYKQNKLAMALQCEAILVRLRLLLRQQNRQAEVILDAEMDSDSAVLSHTDWWGITNEQMEDTIRRHMELQLRTVQDPRWQDALQKTLELLDAENYPAVAAFIWTSLLPYLQAQNAATAVALWKNIHQRLMAAEPDCTAIVKYNADASRAQRRQ